MHIFSIIITSLLFIFSPALAQDVPCMATDKNCMLEQLEMLTGDIEDTRWKDQTYRELAKLLAREKQTEKAISLIVKIEKPDTKAMTIRGIGMEAASTGLAQDEYNMLFKALRTEAEKIEHPPSYAIALTYIAMAQAFAGDDSGAMLTAKDMKNEALRNKAFGESAEIQAEHDRFSAAMTSIAAIESLGYRNKAHRIISKIFADRKKYDEALKAAIAIENTYQKAQAILYILAKQISPEEVSLVE